MSSSYFQVDCSLAGCLFHFVKEISVCDQHTDGGRWSFSRFVRAKDVQKQHRMKSIAHVGRPSPLPTTRNILGACSQLQYVHSSSNFWCVIELELQPPPHIKGCCVVVGASSLATAADAR